jgi:hypothetical protein
MRIISFIRRLIKKESSNNFIQPSVNQSLIYESLKPFIMLEKALKVIKTQATEFDRKQYIPVILVDQQAYWISNNTLFVADEVDGAIDKDTTRAVDTMSMNKVQLDKTIFIVESLTEGAQDDNWNSRNKNL